MSHEETIVRKELRLAYGVVWACGVAFIVLGSWLPFDFGTTSLAEAWSRLQTRADLSRADFALNLLIAIPVAWSLAGWISPRPWRGVSALAIAAIAFAAQAGLSVMVELGQAWSLTRTPSWWDCVAQSLGAAVGVVGWALLSGRVLDLGVRLIGEGTVHGKLAWRLSWYAVGFMVWSLLPANPVLSLGELASRYRAGCIRMNPLAGLPSSPGELALDLGMSALACLPIGALAVVGGRVLKSAKGRGADLAALIVAVCGLPLAAELLQIFIHDRVAAAADVLAGWAGVASGWVITAKLLPTERHKAERLTTNQWGAFAKWGMAFTGYLGFVTLVDWAPMNFDLSSEFVKPRLADLRQAPLGRGDGDQMHALTVFVRDAALFIPAGCLATKAACCTRMLRAPVLLFGLAGIALVAIGIEIGQVALPGRTPGFGESLSRFLGAVAGAVGAYRVVSE